LDLSAFGFLSLLFDMAMLLLECVCQVAMITTDNPARPINTHILKLPNLSMRFPRAVWIERSEEEAVVAFGQLRFDCCAREIPTNGHSDYGTAAELSPTASNPTARRC
jgi:hypothetical protein